MSMPYGMGLRVGELLGIRPKDINLARGTISVHGKGFKMRRVFISRALAPVLKTYIDQYQPKDYLFQGQNGGAYAAVSVNAVLKKLRQLKRRSSQRQTNDKNSINLSQHPEVLKKISDNCDFLNGLANN